MNLMFKMSLVFALTGCGLVGGAVASFVQRSNNLPLPSVSASATPTESPTPTAIETPVPTNPPSSLPTPSVTATPTPLATELPKDVSVSEKTTVNGKVYDEEGTPVEGATVQLKNKSGDENFELKTTTVGGLYVFNNVTAGVVIEIAVTKTGYSNQSRIEVLKSNRTGNPEANTYDFGTPDSSKAKFDPLSLKKVGG